MAKIDSIIELFHKFPGGEWEGDDYSVNINIDQDSLHLIDELDQHDLLLPGSLGGEVGEVKEIVFQAERSQNLFVAPKIQSLLSHSIYSSHPPREIVVCNPLDHYSANSLPEKKDLQCYLDIVSLINILTDASDHVDHSSGSLSLIFLCKEKIEIPVIYSDTDLVPWNSFDDFKAMYSDTMHASQRKYILKSVLHETLKDIDPKNRLPSLIKGFDLIFSKISQNYELYVSEFSFEKIKKKNKKEISSYLVKINSAFNDIQSQLLTLPIAGLIAASQMETGKENHIKNLFIFSASIGFAILLVFVLRNYYSSLSTIKKEIDDQKKSFEEEYAAFANTFNDDYKAIEKRYKSLRSLGRAVDVTVCLALVAIPTCMLIYLNYGDFLELLSRQQLIVDLHVKIKDFAFSLIQGLDKTLNYLMD